MIVTCLSDSIGRQVFEILIYQSKHWSIFLVNINTEISRKFRIEEANFELLDNYFILLIER